MKTTHQEKFLSILTEAGIPTESRAGELIYDEDPTTTIVTVENHGDVGGYRGFYATWVFGADGALKGVANWA
jgi:hypothetical protein